MRYFLITATMLFALATAANAATNGRWCLNERYAGEGVNCTFATLSQCKASKTSHTDSCTRNPHATTGSGYLKK
jgi:Protein of unknown function (DUF3551)